MPILNVLSNSLFLSSIENYGRRREKQVRWHKETGKGQGEEKVREEKRREGRCRWWQQEREGRGVCSVSSSREHSRW